MSHRREQFIGAWSLQAWRIEYSDGRVSYPFGDDAAGQIIYSADGAMSATVSKAKRPNLSGDNPRLADDAQKARAFVSYFHYAGSWHVEDETVIHSVEFSLNPAMIGTHQIRQARFDGEDQLTLSAREDMGDGNSRHHILAWHRI